MSVDPNMYRQVLGQYPTGVVIITALAPDGEPLGMTIGSFTSVSLDPPLVAFMPSKTSSSWAALREASDQFTVNVLGADQEEVCRAISIRKQRKFVDLTWRPSPAGNPILDRAVAWLDCTTESRLDAGDHEIVLGRVHDLQVAHDGYPLLFFRGGYGSFVPMSMASGDVGLGEVLELVDYARGPMEELSSEFGVEVTAVAQVRDELVVVAAVGRTPESGMPTRVGTRTRFGAPFGSIFAAYGGTALRRAWLSGLGPTAPSDIDLDARLDAIRDRGYAMTLRHHYDIETTGMHYRGRGREARSRTEGTIRSEITKLVDAPSLVHHPELSAADVRAIQAPVFAPDRSVAYALLCWAPTDSADRKLLSRLQRAVVDASRLSTQRIAASQPAQRPRL